MFSLAYLYSPSNEDRNIRSHKQLSDQTTFEDDDDEEINLGFEMTAKQANWEQNPGVAGFDVSSRRITTTLPNVPIPAPNDEEDEDIDSVDLI